MKRISGVKRRFGISERAAKRKSGGRSGMASNKHHHHGTAQNLMALLKWRRTFQLNNMQKIEGQWTK